MNTINSGLFDTSCVPQGWFDECCQDQGWFDKDLLEYSEEQIQRIPRKAKGGGGRNEDEDRRSKDLAVWNVPFHLNPIFGEIPTDNLQFTDPEYSLPEYGSNVNFEDFAKRVIYIHKSEEGMIRFRKTVRMMVRRQEERNRLTKQVVVVSGVSYIVYRVIRAIVTKS